jgi:hypothetical protein
MRTTRLFFPSLALVLAGLACGVPALAQAQDPTPPMAPPVAPHADPDDVLYREALRLLDDGRPDEASEMLRRFVGQQPKHAGAWLDLAISQCELGNASEAERLFGEVERRFNPPPGILEAIAHYRTRGCRKIAAGDGKPGGALLLSATRGHDDNVNQGASNPRFAIGTGSEQTDYELSPDFLPRSDNFSQLSASWLHPLGKAGTNAIVQVYSRWHDRERDLDTASVLGAVERSWTPGTWRLRGTAALGYVTLDRALYQRQEQLQVRASPPLSPLLGLPQGVEFAMSANASRVSYPTRPAYDGTTLELGGIAAYRAKRHLSQATLTRLHDDSSAGRPGGDREGWFGSLQWYGDVAERVTVEAGLSHQHWRSADIYSAGLIEARRKQNMTTLRAAGQWTLRPHTSLTLEWRGTFNRENISLFQYNSRALQLSLRWDNF